MEDSFLGFASVTAGTKDTTFTTVYTQLLTINIIDFHIQSSHFLRQNKTELEPGSYLPNIDAFGKDVLNFQHQVAATSSSCFMTAKKNSASCKDQQVTQENGPPKVVQYSYSCVVGLVRWRPPNLPKTARLLASESRLDSTSTSNPPMSRSCLVIDSSDFHTGLVPCCHEYFFNPNKSRNSNESLHNLFTKESGILSSKPLPT